ncbi:hypothetical protein AAF712_015858 [Marasmius tenuissimus]|uniref:Uncharacterized protein n=1 Tax=Marasmius tenuissimus TaxID=585030 RepID=A0ABR2Z9E5_9AGAR
MDIVNNDINDVSLVAPTFPAHGDSCPQCSVGHVVRRACRGFFNPSHFGRTYVKCSLNHDEHLNIGSPGNWRLKGLRLSQCSYFQWVDDPRGPSAVHKDVCAYCLHPTHKPNQACTWKACLHCCKLIRDHTTEGHCKNSSHKQAFLEQMKKISDLQPATDFNPLPLSRSLQQHGELPVTPDAPWPSTSAEPVSSKPAFYRPLTPMFQVQFPPDFINGSTTPANHTQRRHEINNVVTVEFYWKDRLEPATITVPAPNIPAFHPQESDTLQEFLNGRNSFCYARNGQWIGSEVPLDNISRGQTLVLGDIALVGNEAPRESESSHSEKRSYTMVSPTKRAASATPEDTSPLKRRALNHIEVFELTSESESEHLPFSVPSTPTPSPRKSTQTASIAPQKIVSNWSRDYAIDIDVNFKEMLHLQSMGRSKKEAYEQVFQRIWAKSTCNGHLHIYNHPDMKLKISEVVREGRTPAGVWRNVVEYFDCYVKGK